MVTSSTAAPLRDRRWLATFRGWLANFCSRAVLALVGRRSRRINSSGLRTGGIALSLSGHLPAPDHENTIALICDLKGESGIRIGARPITAIVPEVADALYELVRSTLVRKCKKERPRTAEKVVAISRHAWKVVRRLSEQVLSPTTMNIEAAFGRSFSVN
jgi:hypothetical protein